MVGKSADHATAIVDASTNGRTAVVTMDDFFITKSPGYWQIILRLLRCGVGREGTRAGPSKKFGPVASRSRRLRITAILCEMEPATRMDAKTSNTSRLQRALHQAPETHSNRLQPPSSSHGLPCQQLMWSRTAIPSGSATSTMTLVISIRARRCRVASGVIVHQNDRIIRAIPHGQIAL